MQNLYFWKLLVLLQLSLSFFFFKKNLITNAYVNQCLKSRNQIFLKFSLDWIRTWVTGIWYHWNSKYLKSEFFYCEKYFKVLLTLWNDRVGLRGRYDMRKSTMLHCEHCLTAQWKCMVLIHKNPQNQKCLPEYQSLKIDL